MQCSQEEDITWGADQEGLLIWKKDVVFAHQPLRNQWGPKGGDISFKVSLRFLVLVNMASSVIQSFSKHLLQVCHMPSPI